ncbi:MAG: phosphoribosylglycinamide formyltransferase [Bacteriovoracia bacterium]
MKEDQREPVSIVVFASGRGSGFASIVSAIAAGRLRARVACLVCDRAGAPVLQKARAAGIPTALVEPQGGSREAYDRRILQAIQPYSPRFVVLAGFRRILSDVLLREFSSPEGYARVVNVHPSLLPAFPGLESYRQAFAYGCKVTGVTVHLVDLDLDHGPICAQESFAIDDCVSAEAVEARGLAIEHRLYPETLDWVVREEFALRGRSVERARSH